MFGSTPSVSGSRVIGVLAASGCLLGALYLGTTWRDEHRLDQANAAGRAGDYRRALDRASAITGAPVLSRALMTRGYALVELGDTHGAVDAFERAVQEAPNDWSARRALAVALLADGRRPEAQRQLARAVTLNPALSLPPGFIR